MIAFSKLGKLSEKNHIKDWDEIFKNFHLSGKNTNSTFFTGERDGSNKRRTTKVGSAKKIALSTREYHESF